MLYYDSTYILVLIGFLLAMAAQGLVSGSFNKWSDVISSTGLTGRETARRILDAGGMHDVPVEHISGSMTDNYDPENNVLYLSDTVYNENTVAAIGVAAHECGHALQDKEAYFPLRLRSNLVPLANIGSQAAVPLFFAGLVLSFEPLQKIGIYCFLFAVLFYLVTLPVEFNASRRAVAILSDGILPDDELSGVKRVLMAAAMTYVASALQSMLQLVRLILLSGSRRRRD
ncbi:MAG: zinc metallopeptidase [Clostridia bacterium]|nr:zinc metallopeptidase [Clostridia bacterium]